MPINGAVSLVLLDRDGVLNETLHSAGHRGPRNVDELRIFPEVTTFCSLIEELGIRASVVTNQPDISRGNLLLEDELEIERKILGQLPSGALYLRCPHDNTEKCLCRKPQPGMLIEAMNHFGADTAESLMVGDRWTDILAARNAGVKSVLIRRPWSWEGSSQGKPPENLLPDEEIDNLLDLLSLMGMSAN